VVLDTNIVLDLLVFHDPRSAELRVALEGGRLHWLATGPMRDELERVLDYPQLKPRLSHHGLSAETVLAAFDASVSLCPVAPKAIYTCKDPDDQKFIDLAVAHQAGLLSKDKAVLVMRKRLERLGVTLNPGADEKALCMVEPKSQSLRASLA
jgi:putative PIN family toxin of toxin-antitoxin system